MKKFLTILTLLAFTLTLTMGCVGCKDVDGAVTDPESDAEGITDGITNEVTDETTDSVTDNSTDGSTDDSTNDDIDNSDDEDLKTIKILAIGNSFSIDAMEHLYGILKDGGYDRVVLGNLYIGGCSLNTHWSNITGDKSAYTYYKNTSGSWGETAGTKLSAALKSEKWDYITIQQASGGSGVASTYSNLQNILNYVDTNKTNPDAKILWHMTWAYEGDSTHGDFAKYNNDQMTMYNAIVSAVNSDVKTKGLIDGIIPSGTTVQNLRTSYIGDNVTRDGYHLNKGFGRYAAALTWYAYITGNSVDEIDWVPSSYSGISADMVAIKESVRNAIKSPDSVTKSKYLVVTDAAKFVSVGLDIEDYEVLELNMTTGRFYNSTKSHSLRSSADGEPTTLLSKYSASSVFSKTDLPVGSVIIVDSDYQYRPDAWKDGSTLTTSRPNNVSTGFVTVTEEWWGSFTLRGFNLSRTDGGVMTDSDNVHLRIYVPKAKNKTRGVSDMRLPVFYCCSYHE